MKFFTVLPLSFLVFQPFRREWSPSMIKYVKASTKFPTFSWTPNPISIFLDTTQLPCIWRDTLPDSHVFGTPCISCLCETLYILVYSLLSNVVNISGVNVPTYPTTTPKLSGQNQPIKVRIKGFEGFEII